MKKMTRLKTMAGAIVLCLLCISADSTNKSLFRSQSDRIDDLEKQNLELKKQVAELNQKLDILARRVNDCSNGGGAGNSFTDENVSHGPGASVPGQLETVRIRPETGRAGATPGRRKGTLTIASSENNSIAPMDYQPSPTPSSGAALPGTNFVPMPDPANPSSPPPVVSYTPASAPASAAPLATGEAAAYKQLKEMWTSDRTDLAVPLMEEYLKRHPKGAHEDEVAWRLGEYYYGHGEYRRAVEPLKKVRLVHYTSNLAPEAIYTLGLCYAELGMMKEAEEALEEVESIYPFSDAAPKATKKLESIR